MYGYARVSIREPEDKNLDLQVERVEMLQKGPSSHVGTAPTGSNRHGGVVLMQLGTTTSTVGGG